MSVADYAIIPMQDYLGLGSEGRMNTPSTLGGNWTWRMNQGSLEDELALKIRNMIHLYGREQEPNDKCERKRGFVMGNCYNQRYCKINAELASVQFHVR